MEHERDNALNERSDSTRRPSRTAGTGGNLPDNRSRLDRLKGLSPIEKGSSKLDEDFMPNDATQKGFRATGRDPNFLRKQVLKRAYGVLTRTPDDGTGLVPGTPFVKAGAAQLMANLKKRAADVGAPGASAASRAIGFLSPAEGEESVSGLSVPKLQLLARIASRYKNKRA